MSRERQITLMRAAHWPVFVAAALVIALGIAEQMWAPVAVAVVCVLVLARTYVVLGRLRADGLG